MLPLEVLLMPRFTRSLFAFLTMMVALPPASAAPTGEELFRAPVVLRVAGMSEVRTQTVVYAKDSAGERRADIYRPPTGSRFPAVVFIHGGFPEIPGLEGRTAGQYQSWGRLLAASGLAAVAFDHRLRVGANGAVHVDEAIADVKSVQAYLRMHATELSIDPERLCWFAVSAGGPLLTVPLNEGTAPRCLVNFYAFADVQGLGMFSRSLSPAAARKLSLVEYADRLPPIFVARAGRDTVPQMKETLDRFVARALAADAPLTLFDHATGPHAFDVLADDARSREIITATIAFLRTHLLG